MGYLVENPACGLRKRGSNEFSDGFLEKSSSPGLEKNVQDGVKKDKPGKWLEVEAEVF